MVTVKRRHRNSKIQIDLRGPGGNAFAILGLAGDLANKLYWHADKKEEMMLKA